MPPPYRTAALLFVMPAAASLLIGCAPNLFADNDAATEWKLRRYYDNDSARVTSEGRKQGSANGFGLPMGKSSQ